MHPRWNGTSLSDYGLECKTGLTGGNITVEIQSSVRYTWGLAVVLVVTALPLLVIGGGPFGKRMMTRYITFAKKDAWVWTRATIATKRQKPFGLNTET